MDTTMAVGMGLVLFGLGTFMGYAAGYFDGFKKGIKR